MDILEDPLEDLLKGILKGILKSLLCRLYQVIFHTPAVPHSAVLIPCHFVLNAFVSEAWTIQLPLQTRLFPHSNFKIGEL